MAIFFKQNKYQNNVYTIPFLQIFHFCNISILQSKLLDAIFVHLLRFPLLPLFFWKEPQHPYYTLTTIIAFAELPEMAGIQVGTLGLRSPCFPHTESYQHQVITWNATLWSIGIGFLGGCQGLKIWRVTLLWGETWPIGSERQEAFEQKNSLPFLSAVDHSEVWFLLAALPDTPAAHLLCLYQAYCEMWPEQWHITSHCFASFLPHFHCFLTLTIFSLHFPSKEATC